MGELCKRFLALYGKHECCTINLNDCIQQLGVERRRIYDIINILEGLSVVTKKCKNVYEWKGFERLRQEIAHFENNASTPHEGAFTSKVTPLFSTQIVAHTIKCEKSLGFLCIHFINFIIQSGKEISLVQCANDFIALYQKEDAIGRISSIIRRLYDIANVLSSLGLLEKLSQSTQKKPVFKWLGEEGLQRMMSNDTSSESSHCSISNEACGESMHVIKWLVEEGKSNKLSLLSLRAIMKRKRFYVKPSTMHCMCTPMSSEKAQSLASTAEKSPINPSKKKCVELHVSPLRDLTNFSV